jgi:thiol-disulfide isomerase/thioredoxin
MMKKLIFLLLGTCVSLWTLGQTHCFEDCIINSEKSKLPDPERNLEILKELVGCKAPRFSVTTIDNKVLDLNNFKGKVVVINFWFTTCAPCIAEIPGLNKLAADYRDKNVIFVSFARNTPETLNHFLKTTKFNYLNVSSEFDTQKTYCIIAGWPTNIVIDKKGIVQQIFSGGEIDNTAPQKIYNKLKPTIDKSLIEGI